MSSNARPIYENDETLARESAVARYLGAKWSAVLYKLPIAYRLDFAVTRGVEREILAWLEIKGAPNAFYKRPQNALLARTAKVIEPAYAQLAVLKWRAGLGLALATGLPFIVVFDYRDLVVFHEYDARTAYGYEIGGRSDPRDEGDQEPMVRIPRVALKVLGKCPRE